MTDLHPNWQATDASAEEQSLPVHIVSKPKQNEQPVATPVAHPPHMQRLSRQPAAIAGMLLAISIGLSFFFGMDRGSKTTVRITENGFLPKAVTVAVGSDIIWINETDRPHVLQSDALCTLNRECFSTSAIAPGARDTFAITSDFSAGTYTYYSINTRGMEASITVLADNADTNSTAGKTAAQQNLAQATPFDNAAQSSAATSATGASASAFSSASTKAALPFKAENDLTDSNALFGLNGTLPPDGLTEERDQMPFDAAFSSSGSRQNPGNPVAQLPVNPYTVNSTRTHPFDAQGKPVVAGNSSSLAKGTLHSGAPRPLSQPSTGPALWITIAGTFVLLFFATRKLLKRAY